LQAQALTIYRLCDKLIAAKIMEDEKMIDYDKRTTVEIDE